MDRKAMLRFALTLCLAIVSLAVFFGLMTGGQEQVYAAPPQSVRGAFSARPAPPDKSVGVKGPSGPAAPLAELQVCSTCPYTTVQAAVDAASVDDTIKVASGTYTSGVGVPVVSITKSLTLIGGYVSSTTSVDWTTSDPDANPTILDGEGNNRVVYITGSITITVEGFHIYNGDAGVNYGGGVYVDTATVTLRDNRIYSNTANNGGGVYICLCSETTLNNNRIYANTATGGVAGLGGGIHLCHTPTATLSGNTISNNWARKGGGLYSYQIGDVALSDNTFLSNTALLRGGGIRLADSTVALTNNIIADNQAGTTGSGMYVEANSNINLYHNTIARNTDGDGSGIHVNNGAVALTNTILVSHSVGITVASGSAATLDYTLWGTATWANGVNTGGVGTINSTNEITGNPDFVDSEYRIGPNSDAIDAGTSAGVSKDRDGNDRDAQPDIGAYEAQTTLSLVKSMDDPTPNSGQLITYTIVVTNDGAHTATGAVISDTWDPAASLAFAGAVAIDPIQPGAILATSAASMPVVASNVTITGEECVTITFQVTVGTGLPNGTIVTNTAAVTSTEVITPEMDWVIVTVQSPDLTLTKTANITMPNPGQLITYEIVVANDGGQDATDAVISDTWKPTDTLNFVGPVTIDPPQSGAITATSQYSLPTLVSNLTITGGESVTITFPVTVDAGLAGGTLITNTAAVTSSEVLTPETDWEVVTVQGQPPNLVLTKTVDNSTPNAGQVITYEIVVLNNGGQNATGAVISDTLSGDLTFAGPVTIDPPQSGAITATSQYSLPTLVSNLTITGGESVTVTFPVTVNVGVTGGTVITNTAAVTSTEVVTPETDWVTVTVSRPEPDWDKLVYVSSTTPITDFTNSITVTTGDVITIVDRVWITYTNPVTFTLVETWTNSLSLVYSTTTTGTVVPGTGVLTWTAKSVLTETWHVLTKTFHVTGATLFDYVTETLSVEGADPQPDPITLTFRNISACLPVSIDVLDSDSPVELGEAMHFTATVSGDPIITYTWDFGGAGSGSGTNGATPAYTYTTDGTYTVTLDVANGCPSTDTDFITVTVNPPPAPPEPDWDKLVYVNGISKTTASPITVLLSDTVEVVDWVWITYTGNVTFTLVETWTSSLELTNVISNAGVVLTDTSVLTWTAVNVAPNTWHVITKTFDVTDTGWLYDYVTETLDVEGAALESRVLTFEHGCEPLTDVGFTNVPTNPQPGVVVTFTAKYTPSYAAQPITYTWDISGIVLLEGNPLLYTFLTSDTYTILITATNPCGRLVTATDSITVAGAPFTPTYGVTLTVTPPDAKPGDPGEMVTYMLQVTNTGNVADFFDLSLAGDDWETDVTPPWVNLLPTGTAQITVTVTVTDLAKCGESDAVTVTVTARSPSTATASSVLTTTASTVRDVTVDAPITAKSGPSGALVTYTLYVTNTGNCVDTFGISESSVWTTTLSTDTINLDSDDGTSVVVTVTVPVTTACSAFDTATIIVTSTLTVSDSAMLTTSIVQSHCVTIEPLAIDQQSGAPGEAVIYTLPVSNTGNCSDTYAMSRLAPPGWTTTFSPTNFFLDAKDGLDVIVTITVPITARPGDPPDVATVQVSGTTSLVTDTAVLTTTVSRPQGGWDKLVYVNDTFSGTTPITSPITVIAGDTVTIVDRVWVTYTVPVTFTLVETWTNSLELQTYTDTVNSVTTYTNPLIWHAVNVSPNVLHVLTKTFLVTGTGWTYDYVTETLEVEESGFKETRVLTFEYTTVCTPVQIISLTSDSPVELGTVMNFTAIVTGDTPITYTWDFDNDGTPEQSGVGLNVVSYTYAATGGYTVTLDVENGCPSTDTDFITVTVTCTPVSITDLRSDSLVNVGAAMNFTATVTGTQPITYTWNFDDGWSDGPYTDTDTTITATHTYTAPGAYTVTLVVTNACDTDSDFITVTVSGGVELYQPTEWLTSPYAIAVHHVPITNTSGATRTFNITYGNYSWVMGHATRPDVELSAEVITLGQFSNVTATLVVTVHIPSTVGSNVTDTVTITVTEQAGPIQATSVLTTCTGCRYDFDANNSIDGLDVFEVVFNAGINPYYNFDYPSNNTVDGLDVFQVVSNAGSCP